MKQKLLLVSLLHFLLLACAQQPVRDKRAEHNPQVQVEENVLRVYFDYKTVGLTSENAENLKQVISAIETQKPVQIIIEGHTDDVGSNEYNLKLSQQRADAIKALLIGKVNVEKDFIFAIGVGEGQPVASNESEAGRLKNRRVDIRMILSQ